MFYRYVAERDDETQWLITLIPFFVENFDGEVIYDDDYQIIVAQKL